jgi:hypothetical protein
VPAAMVTVYSSWKAWVDDMVRVLAKLRATGGRNPLPWDGRGFRAGRRVDRGKR